VNRRLLSLAFLPVVVALALPVRAQEPPVPQGGCTGTFAGRWNTDFGWVEFQLQGSQARGYYEWWGGSGTVQAVVEGRKLSGRWAAREATAEGEIELILTEDGRSFSGSWTRDRGDERWTSGTWSGTCATKEPMVLPDRTDCQALLNRHLALQGELTQLESAVTFSEQFFAVQRTINEAREALQSTGQDAKAAAEKIDQLQELVRSNNQQLQEVLQRTGGGLRQAGESMGEVGETLDAVSNALQVLEIAVRARNMTPADSLRAFGEYFTTIANGLEPLIKAVPVLGTFIHLYSKAIEACATSVEQINKEAERRQRLARELTGRPLYVQPGTEWEAQQRAINEKRAELQSVENQLLEQCSDTVRFVDGRPEPVVENALMREIEQARARARAHYQELGLQVERASLAAGEAWRRFDRARKDYDELRRRLSGGASWARVSANFTPERLAELRQELEALGPERPLTLDSSLSQAEKLRRAEEWRRNNERRHALRLDIASLEQSLRALDAAEHNLRDTQSAHARAEEEYRRLDQQYTEGQRDFLLREAEAKGWDPWWLRFRYGDLFGPPAAPPR